MKSSFLFVIILLTATTGFACEICGCGNNNFQIGLLPNFRNGFVGLRYSYSSFHSEMADDHSEFSRDRYQSLEVWGGYQVRRLQLMTFIPYYQAKKVSDDGTSSTSGVGDMMVLANYKIISSTGLSGDLTKTIRNELYLGGGIKFATGVNRVNALDPEFNMGSFNSQPGTGSTDALATLTHNLLWNNSGVITNVAYRFNGSNPQGFRFGNCFYETTSFFHTFKTGSMKVNPLVGVNLMINNTNRFNSTEIQGSNGHMLNTVVGINIVAGKLGFLANTFIPATQRMYEGQTVLKTRSTVGLTFSF